MIILNLSTCLRQMVLFASLLSAIVCRASAPETLPPFLLDIKTLDASNVADNAR